MAAYAVTNLRAALKLAIQGITTAAVAGYKTDIKTVYDPPEDPENAQAFPIVNLSMSRENPIGDYLQGNQELYDIDVDVELEFYFQTDNLPLAQDNAIGDVIKWSGNNYYVPDSGGDATAFVCTYAGSERWGYEPQSGSAPNGGVTIRLRVHYRTMVSNPEVIR